MAGAWCATGDLAAQLRRGAEAPAVAEVRRGDFLLGVGVAHAADGRYPLAGLRGDLWAVGDLHLAYGLGDGVLLEVRGPVLQVLEIDALEDDPPGPRDPGLADGVTSDAGDFRLSTSFLPIGETSGFSAGGRIMVKLPNTDEARGIGLNTTDVTLAALFSYGAGPWRATGWAGVGILGAPLQRFEQNDVVAYAAEGLWRVSPRLRLAAGLRGRASTRGQVPVGTEDLGVAHAAAEWRLGPWLLDVGAGRGYAGNSPDWTLEVGLSRALARGPGAGHRARDRTAFRMPSGEVEPSP